MNDSSIKKLLPLLLVLLIDSMGLGILFPILAVAFINPSVHFFSVDISHSLRIIDYAVVISVFMFCWFFGAAILGEYSDHRGRKFCLLVCLLGAVVGYGLSALALIWHSLSLLIVGRVVAGLTAGSQSIAQAAVVDVSAETNLNKNMGYMTFVVCIGFVVGPMIGGLFSDTHLVPWFGLATPMYIAALLSLLNVFLLKFYYHEVDVKRNNKKFNVLIAVELFAQAFSHPKIKRLCIIFVVFIFGWSNYYSFVSLYMVDTFQYTIIKTALFNACLGAGFCLGSGFLNARLSMFSSKKVALVTIFIAVITCILTLFSRNQVFIWMLAFIIGTCISIIFPNIITLFSQQVSAQEQGWVMGVSGAMMALSFGLSTLAAGASSIFFITLPLWFASGGLALSFCILYGAQFKEKLIKK